MGDLRMEKQDVLQIRVETVDEKEVPALIQGQFTMMGELRKEIERASNNAFDAKEVVINEVGPKVMSKKEAIENLQTATLSLADAQVDAMNAQKLSFEYQQKLADISKFLFRLGLTNIALNRAVVSELEARLRDASEEELDDLTRAEIENLLKRLIMQQDIDKKNEDLTKIVKELSIRVDCQEKELEALRKEVKNLKELLPS